MSQSLAKILVHLTFSTKERRPLLRDEEREKLHAYMIGVLENLKSPSLEGIGNKRRRKMTRSSFRLGGVFELRRERFLIQ